jgi:hypothetical protein
VFSITLSSGTPLYRLEPFSRACNHPQMMEKSYRPTGWLGLILGTRVYFNFHPAAVETDAAFMQQIDAVVRDLGARGKAKRSVSRAAEGAPPALAGRLLEPSPAPAAAPVRAAAPVSAMAAPAAARAPAMAPDRGSFTPSMPLSSPAAMMGQPRTSASDAALMEFMLGQQRLILEREEQLRAETEARVRAEALALLSLSDYASVLLFTGGFVWGVV